MKNFSLLFSPSHFSAMLHSFILRRKKNERAVPLIPEVSRILAHGTISRHNERNLHLTYKIPMKYRDRGISIYLRSVSLQMDLLIWSPKFNIHSLSDELHFSCLLLTQPTTQAVLWCKLSRTDI